MKDLYKPIIFLWALFVSFLIPYPICKLLEYFGVGDSLIGIFYCLIWISIVPLLVKLDEILDKKL